MGETTIAIAKAHPQADFIAVEVHGPGVGSLLHLLREAGFASLGRSAEYYGLGLSLGNGDVTLLELANGYRALVNGGDIMLVAGELGGAGFRVVLPRQM